MKHLFSACFGEFTRMTRQVHICGGEIRVLPVLTLLLTTVWRVGAAADAWEALPEYQFGQSREPLATIEEQIRQSNATERQEIEGRLLVILKSPSTSKDSRRFICRWLGIVGTEKSVAPLAALLTDPDLAHSARIGLERLPYASVGHALTEALPGVKGDLLLGVISSINAKRVEEAVPALTELLKNSEPPVVRAALAALGQIGTEAASDALGSAEVSAALGRDLAKARISAGARLAESGRRSEAAVVFRELMAGSGQPASIRVAAFQGLARTLQAEDAARLIINALESDDALMRSAAVSAFAGAGEARDTVAGRLTTMQPKGQLLLLGILADAPEVAARQSLLQVAEAATDPAVKAAAVECLAVHGTAEDVPLVAKWAANGEAPVKAAARKTLQRISGRGVNAALLRLIESADSGQRKAVMEALPSRRMESALPTLNRLMQGNDSGLAAEAAQTIGLMGGTAQLKDLAQVVTRADNDQVRDAAQEAIRTICTRAEDRRACASIIEEELQNASSPQSRVALLPVTVYTGGETGLRLVVKAMEDPDSTVRSTAFRTLVSWPEARAATPLLRFAETNSQSSQAIVALRDGCLRLAEMEEVPAGERSSILRAVTQVARRAEEKKRAVSLMGQVPSLDLIEALQRLAANPDLKSEAVTSTIQLARMLGAVYPRQSMAALEEVNRFADTPELRKQLENGMKAVRNAGQSPQGYLMGWMVSGPYTEADQDAEHLFAVAFSPEKTPEQVEWRPLSAPSSGIVDLGRLMPGENRVAYLRASLISDQAQKALLELGSDDGLKVWLNGKVVHANNTVRPCSPGQDKVSVSLNEGDNVLLLKVTQGGGEFAAVARLLGSDGKPLSNVLVGAATK